MTTTVLVILVLVVVGFAVWIAAGRVKSLLREREQLRERHSRETEALQAEWQARLNDQRTQYEQRLAEQKAEAEQRLREQKEETERRLSAQKEEFKAGKDSMSLAFKDVAAQVLEEERKKLREIDERKMEDTVRPIEERIKELHKALGDSRETQARQSASFAEQMRQLLESTRAVSTHADSLSRALRGNVKKQGNWGEMLLGSILEQSGLREGQEYSVQDVHTDEEGRRLIPDVVVRLPREERRVVIDSKVSLNAFMDYNEAQTEEQAAVAAKAHVDSVRKHIKELAQKDYAKTIRSEVGFVLMFIQNDAAYMLAMQTDETLTQEAYDRGVILTSPMTLMMTLKIVYNIWQADKQDKNVKKIVEEVTKLYDKVVGFQETYLKIGRELDSAKAAYDLAHKQLSEGTGNVVGRFETIRKMGGLTPKKQLKGGDETMNDE